MLKFNAESILSLRDEPLKKDSHSLRTSAGKENQKMNTDQNDHTFLKDLKESTKKKYRRSVLRREAEKSLSKDDDLLWDPSFISIASLSQVQSNAHKTERNTFQSINNGNEVKIMEYQAAPKEISFDFIDEVFEISMALNRRPVKAAAIERLSRLQSRSDFKFKNLIDASSQTADSTCLRLTTSLALVANDLASKIITTKDDQNLRELNALLSSLQILNKAFLEVGVENADQQKMINAKLLSELAKRCLNELENDDKTVQGKSCSEIKCRIKKEATKLFEISRPNN